jgi:RNA polymerase sigma-70 factor, ECF subfamily
VSEDTSALPDFGDVYTTHFAFVWRCLQGLGVPGEQLDDLTQETFVVVYRRLSEYQPNSSLRAWLYGILRLVARNQRRGQLRRLMATARLKHEPKATQTGPFDAAVVHQAQHILIEFLDTLNSDRREVFYLADIEDMPAPELASALNIPLNTAYSRLRRARADLESWLAARGIDS